MGRTWKKIVTKVSGMMLSAVVMAGCIGADTALAVERTYTVESGDTLEKIAEEQYGSRDWWDVLYTLNQSSIQDPNAIYIGQQLKLSTDSSPLVEQSDCSVPMLLKYILVTGGVEEESAKSFLAQGTWPDGLSVPASDAVLTQEGRIDWSQAPENGYTLDAQGKPVKAVYVPQMNEVIDRYGSSTGRYTSPVNGAVPYSYDDRSLPYVEDVSSYHQYRVTGDISRLEEYVNACRSQDAATADLIDRMVNQYYQGDIHNMKVYSGEVAPAFGHKGGGIQYEFPLSIDILCRLGILQEVN